MNGVAWAALGLAVVAVTPAGIVSVLLQGLIADRDRRIATLRQSLANACGSLMDAERERDSYADALASVVRLAELGDPAGVAAHANQALQGGDYHGRLRGAQDALEVATEDAEEANLLVCSCLDEVGRP